MVESHGLGLMSEKYRLSLTQAAPSYKWKLLSVGFTLSIRVVDRLPAGAVPGAALHTELLGTGSGSGATPASSSAESESSVVGVGSVGTLVLLGVVSGVSPGSGPLLGEGNVGSPEAVVGSLVVGTEGSVAGETFTPGPVEPLVGVTLTGVELAVPGVTFEPAGCKGSGEIAVCAGVDALGAGAFVSVASLPSSPEQPATVKQQAATTLSVNMWGEETTRLFGTNGIGRNW